ncbi:MAG TPA: hypothetical protein DEA08_08545 [Planctomycetes bacterium]|nr:hypothetical protein [Planctomycetota bacterium]
MATNYDVLFLRTLVEQRQLAREHALDCLRRIDAAGARAPTAYQAVLHLDMVDEGTARKTHTRVMAHFEQSGEAVVRVSQEEAVRGVSDEAPALPQRPATPPARYFDLGPQGENLDGYQLGPLIAHGSCYSSYQGRGPEGEATRVCVLSSRFEQHPELLREVTSELRAWSGFRSEGGAGPLRLGRTLQRGERPPQTVVIYPALPGQSLREFLSEHGPLPELEALELVLDVCELLALAHSKGLRVGDLRSDLVCFDGERARLSDLGLSRANCIAAGFAPLGLSFGHPSYLAPEVLQEGLRRPTPATDVYALGILYYELICGAPPFRDPNPRAVLESHLVRALPPPPPEVEFGTVTAGVVLRMTAKDVGERAQDTSALVRALRAFHAGRPFQIPVGPPELPSGAGPISADEWTEASTKASQNDEADDWTESMLGAAPVGPTELQPLASGSILLDDARLSGRLPRELLARLEAANASEMALVEATEVRAQAPPAKPRPPIEIGEKLGRGAVGASYEGTWREREGEAVVLKVISRKFAKHEEILARIRADLDAASELRHQNVVSVLGRVEAEGREVVIEERSSGQTLRSLLDERKTLPVDEAVALIRDVGRALGAAQQQGLSHGDLRPEKVYVEATRARVADFGHARGSCLGAGLGKYGLYFGHPYYLAPEILQQRLEAPDLRCDLYALGILFYEAVCGRLPFKEPGIKKNLLAHMKRPLPPPPPEVALPQTVADTILRMTAKRADERMSSLEELDEALDECLEASMVSADSMVASAIQSAVKVEEFDPMASSVGDAARADWGHRSQEMTRPAEGWSKEKIKAAAQTAAQTGPAWNAQATANELYTDLEKENELAAAVDAAAKERRPPSARSGRRKQQPQGEGGGLKVVLLATALLAIVGGSAAFVALRETEERGGGAGPAPSATVAGPVAGPNRGQQAAALAAKEDAAAKEAIGEYQRRAQALLDRDEFPALLALDGEVFQGQVAARADVKDAVRVVEAKAMAQARERAQKLARRVAQLIEGDDLAKAKQLLAEAAAWAPEGVGLAEVRDQLENAAAAERGRLEQFGAPGKRDPERFARLLGRKLRGWQRGAGRCYESGGVVLRYRDMELLEADLRVARGGAPSLGTTSSGTSALQLSSGRRPTVVSWDPELFGASELIARIRPEKGARVALLIGVDEKGLRGVGISGAGEAVTLGVRGLSGASQVESSEELELHLRCLPKGRAFTITGEAIGNRTRSLRGQHVEPSKIAGRCAVAVQGSAQLVFFRVEAVLSSAYR